MTTSVNMTRIGIEAVKPKGFRFEIGDRKVKGLRLIVQPTGAKSWAVRYTAAGRDRRLTLGPYPTLQLDEARKRASAAKLAVTTGQDPAAQKIEARRIAAAGLDKADRLAAVWKEYDERHLSTKRKATRAAASVVFNRYVIPTLGKRHISEVTKRDVLGILDDLLKSSKPGAANRARAALTAFFNWCLSRDIIQMTPCAGIKPPAPVKFRDRVLTDDEIRWLWRACQEPDSLHPFGRAVQLDILTGARRSEVCCMTDKELKLADTLWRLPAARSKNHREHDVHLTETALAILAAVPRIKSEAGYIFTTTGKTPPSGFSNFKERVDRLMLQYAREEAKARGDDPAKVEIAPWVLHDLRRTMASGMARLGIQLPVIERCLNHVSGSFGGIVGIYQRHTFADEKKAAFEAWSLHVESLVGIKRAASNVTTLRTRRKTG